MSLTQRRNEAKARSTGLRCVSARFWSAVASEARHRLGQAAFDFGHMGGWRKRRRRFALPAQSKGSKLCIAVTNRGNTLDTLFT